MFNRHLTLDQPRVKECDFPFSKDVPFPVLSVMANGHSILKTKLSLALFLQLTCNLQQFLSSK